MATDDRVEEQAARWAVKLDLAAGTAPALQREFSAWLMAHPRHRTAFVRQRAGWQRAGIARGLRPLDGRVDPDLLTAVGGLQIFGRAREGVRGFERRSWRAWFTRPGLALRLGGAAVVVLAVLALVTWQVGGGGKLRTKDYATEIGEHRQIVLPDGTAVDLNTDTVMAVHFTAQRREVRLERGEALFSVARDSQRPFEVRADGVVARAVGTWFSVRLRTPDVVEILVADGRVQVLKAARWWRFAAQLDASASSQGSLLGAGDRALAGPDSQVAVSRVGLAEVKRHWAWTRGLIVFAGEKLPEAVEELNRYNCRHLVVADPTIEGLTIGGPFRTTQPDRFVSALAGAFGVRTFGSGDDDRPGDLRLVGAR